MAQALLIEPHDSRNLSEAIQTAKMLCPVIKDWVGGMCWKGEKFESQTVVIGTKSWHLISFRGVFRTVQYQGIRQAMHAEFGVETVTT